MFREFSQKSDLLERHTPVLPYTASTPPPPPGSQSFFFSTKSEGAFGIGPSPSFEKCVYTYVCVCVCGGGGGVPSSTQRSSDVY